MKYGSESKSRSRAASGAKSRSRAMGNSAGGSFKPCAGCPSPAKCKKAGKCMGVAKKGKK